MTRQAVRLINEDNRRLLAVGLTVASQDVVLIQATDRWIVRER